jgi:flavin-binding protein dodecin
MEDRVYKLIKLTGTSANSIEEAVQNALTRADKSVRNMRWFQVVETRGAISGAAVAQWQVTVEIGFTVEE